MSSQKAKNDLKTYRMTNGKFDEYVAGFKRLARLAGHDLQESAVIEMFAGGLPKMLHVKVIEFGDRLNSFEDWVDEAWKQHQKYLYLTSRFQGDGKKKFTQNQWKRALNKPDANAMDTSAGRTRARAALTEDERTKHMAEGKCFRCHKTGHMSRNCPTKAQSSQARIANQEEPEQVNATKTEGAKKPSAKELVATIRDLEDDDKDKLIQEVFMGKDFS
jgi:Zinc knuckle